MARETEVTLTPNQFEIKEGQLIIKDKEVVEMMEKAIEKAREEARITVGVIVK